MLLVSQIMKIVQNLIFFRSNVRHKLIVRSQITLKLFVCFEINDFAFRWITIHHQFAITKPFTFGNWLLSVFCIFSSILVITVTYCSFTWPFVVWFANPFVVLVAADTGNTSRFIVALTIAVLVIGFVLKIIVSLGISIFVSKCDKSGPFVSVAMLRIFDISATVVGITLKQ